jgi:hypothetical protein
LYTVFKTEVVVIILHTLLLLWYSYYVAFHPFNVKIVLCTNIMCRLTETMTKHLFTAWLVLLLNNYLYHIGTYDGRKHTVEYLVRTIMYICIGLLFANYSNIADEPTIMTPTNNNPVMGYEQLVPPICYFLCLSCTLLSNYNRYRNERDCFTQLIDLKTYSRTVLAILERKHNEI